jgi:hypothetical protein
LTLRDNANFDVRIPWAKSPLTVRIHAHMIFAMSIRENIISAETRAKAIGLSVDDLCRQIGVHRATWQRWKAGVTEPRLSDWERTEAVLASFPAPTHAPQDAAE